MSDVALGIERLVNDLSQAKYGVGYWSREKQYPLNADELKLVVTEFRAKADAARDRILAEHARLQRELDAAMGALRNSGDVVELLNADLARLQAEKPIYHVGDP